MYNYEAHGPQTLNVNSIISTVVVFFSNPKSSGFLSKLAEKQLQVSIIKLFS
jgi:hypothetical protein